MKRNDLKIELEKIGWSVERSCNGLNDFIVNDFGKRTRFVLCDERIELRSNVFGNPFSGTIRLELSKLELHSGSIMGDKLDWVSLRIDGETILQFHRTNTTPQ